MMPNPLSALLRLAQNLDDAGAVKEAAQVDSMAAKFAAWHDDDRIIPKKPRQMNTGSKSDVGADPIQAGDFEFGNLPSFMRPKSQNPDFEDTAETFENKERLQEVAETKHTIALDTKYLLEDLASLILAEVNLRPVTILNKTLAPQQFIRLSFGDAGYVVLSVSMATDQRTLEDLYWVEANSWFGGNKNQLKFPFKLQPGGAVNEDELATMAQRIASKIPDPKNS